MQPTEERLNQIFQDLLDAACICEMSGLLKSLSTEEIAATYEDFLVHYAHELALGALERSEWLCGNLIINANQPSICFLRTALDGIRSEIDQRNAKIEEPLSNGLPN